MEINIEKIQIWTPCGTPLPPISLLLVRSYWNFHTICKSRKETLFVHGNFSIYGLVLYIYTNIYKYIYIYKRIELPQYLCLNEKKKVLESLKDFLQNVQSIFSIFFFVLYWKRKKWTPTPFCPPFPSIFFGGGGSSAASPLEIWDAMPPYLKTLFEQKTEI